MDPKLSCNIYMYVCILAKEEQWTQHPIYYVSNTLHDTEFRYTLGEKIVFVVVTLAKWLAHYFQDHPI